MNILIAAAAVVAYRDQWSWVAACNETGDRYINFSSGRRHRYGVCVRFALSCRDQKWTRRGIGQPVN